MNIDIQKLTPAHAEAYAHFFDVTPHDDRSDRAELPCYCVTWRGDDSYAADPRHWFETREERRSRAIQYVRDGSLQGYLAYDGDRIVGWCNANADCRACVDFLRGYWPIGDPRPDARVLSVFCFMIAPDAQGHGVATKLLERVCRDAAAEGYDCVEAYAYRDPAAVPHDFRGPLALYEKCGFRVSGEREGMAVMRKALKALE